MKIRGIILYFFLALVVISEEVRQPRPKIELGDITLRDGRVLKSVRLLGATDKHLNIVHADGLEQIERKKFTPEILEKYRTEIRELREEYSAEGALRVREMIKAKSKADSEARERKRNADEQARIEKKFAAENAKRDAAAERQRKGSEERAARHAARRAAELARSRDGVLLEPFYIEGGELWLTVRNVHDNPRRLDWRELRARKTDGRLVIPVNCETGDALDRSWDLRSGARRSFTIRWMGGNDEIEAITWADGGQEVARLGAEPKGEEIAGVAK